VLLHDSCGHPAFAPGGKNSAGLVEQKPGQLGLSYINCWTRSPAMARCTAPTTAPPCCPGRCASLDLRGVIQAGSALLEGTRVYPPGPWDEAAFWLTGQHPAALPLRAPDYPERWHAPQSGCFLGARVRLDCFSAVPRIFVIVPARPTCCMPAYLGAVGASRTTRARFRITLPIHGTAHFPGLRPITCR